MCRARLGPDLLARQNWTVQELVDRYMAQHQVVPATLAWLALEWRDVDLRERAVTVRRAYSGGTLVSIRWKTTR